jgi:hypothetical protein
MGYTTTRSGIESTFFFHRSRRTGEQLLGKSSCFAFLRRFNLAPLHRRDVHPSNLPGSPMSEVRAAFIRNVGGPDWDNLKFEFVVVLPCIIVDDLGREFVVFSKHKVEMLPLAFLHIRVKRVTSIVHCIGYTVVNITGDLVTAHELVMWPRWDRDLHAVWGMHAGLVEFHIRIRHDIAQVHPKHDVVATVVLLRVYTLNVSQWIDVTFTVAFWMLDVHINFHCEANT